MNWFDIYSKTIATVGFPLILGAFIYVGRKLQVLDDLKADMAKVKHNLKVVILALIKSEIIVDASEIQGFSPLQLTAKGQELIKMLHFDTTFQEHREEFLQTIAEEKPKFKYDVELAAIKAIYSLYGRPFMADLKIYMYNTPERQLENLAPTLAIYLRDQYLSAHPEITA